MTSPPEPSFAAVTDLAWCGGVLRAPSLRGMTTTAIADQHAAVAGTLLHADAWDLLDAATVAQRSGVDVTAARNVLDRFTAEGVVLAADIDGDTSYRLTSPGVQFAQELTGETPRAWRTETAR